MKNLLNFGWNRTKLNGSITFTLSLCLSLFLCCTTSCSSPPTQGNIQIEQGERAYKTGVSALEMWRYDVALSQFMEALRWNQSVENPTGILKSLHAIAATFEAKGDMVAAIESASAAIRFGLQDAKVDSLPDREIWNPIWIESYWVRATLRAQNKQLIEAQEDLNAYTSRISSEKLSDVIEKVKNLKAFIAIQQEDWNAAESFAQSVLEKLKHSPPSIDYATALQRLAEAHEGQAELVESIEFWEKSLNANRSLGRSQRMILALEGLARVHATLNQLEISSVYAERAQTLTSALAPTH